MTARCCVAVHLKNLALLKIAEVKAKSFTSVRFAPLYDSVTTRVFPGLAGDRMALKLNGKDDRLTRGDFLTLARTIGLTQAAADTAMAELTARIAHAAKTVRHPAFATVTESALPVQAQVLEIVTTRCAAHTNDADQG